MALAFDPGKHRSAVIGAALVLPAVVAGLLSTIRGSTTPATVALSLVLVVVAAAATGDRVAGFVASVSSALWFDFFATEPLHRFAIRSATDLQVTILLMLIGLAVTEIALWGYRAQAKASRRTGYLDGVLRTAEGATASRDSREALVESVADQISGVLEVASCRYVDGPVHDDRYAVLDHDGNVTRGGRQLDVDRHGLPTDEQTALLVLQRGHTVGYFLITAASITAYPSLEQRRVAVLLADQVAAAMHPQGE